LGWGFIDSSVSANLRHKGVERLKVRWFSNKQNIETAGGHAVEGNDVRIGETFFIAHHCAQFAAADADHGFVIEAQPLLYRRLYSFTFEPLPLQ